MIDKLSPVAAQPDADDLRVTLALEEYLAALETGQVLDRSQLRANYPDIADTLDGYLDGLDFMHRAAARMNDGTSDRASEQQPSLDDYEIIHEVGRGGMGIVYEAVQRSLRRRVALKVLSIGATLDPRHLQRFRNEAQAAAQLQHPNIVPIFAVGCEQGVHYYAMRYIDGTTLAQLIRDSQNSDSEVSEVAKHTVVARSPDRATESDRRSQDGRGDRTTTPRATTPVPTAYDATDFARAATIGIQAAEALEHAHQMGVIHRDVKPANLLMDDNGQIWVADFGLARWPADHTITMSGDLLGTLRYMSPEQASARRGLVDHRTDVYSLGATLYELLTLQPVFQGEDRQELLHKILEDDPVPPSRLVRNIPRDLETILLKALSKQVQDRYATAQEFADDLRRFLNGQPIQARRPAIWERAGKWAGRHRSVVVSAAVLLVLIGLGSLVGNILIGREKANTQSAYEKESQARRLEQEARTQADAARDRAERNFRQAQQLLDQVTEIAAVDMAAEADLPQGRRKLLQAVLLYYKQFVEQHNDNKLTHEQLLRGYTRVATLLDAAGRREDARAAWNQAFSIAVTTQDGEDTFHIVPAKNRFRLLQLASVREELKLTRAQAHTLDEEMEPKEKEHPEIVEKDIVVLLKPDQAKRLDQLLLRQAGMWALTDPAVNAKLQLTRVQRAALGAAQNEARGSGPHNDSPLDRVVWVLTPEQRSRWKDLIGAPFAGTLPPPNLTLSGTLVFRMVTVRSGADQKKDDIQGFLPETSPR
jgi:serine/threonine protein kinase